MPSLQDVTLKDLEDQVVNLGDVHSGKPTVIAFLRHFG